MFSLLSITVLAADTEVTVTPLENHITTAEQATFKVTVKSTGNEFQSYTVYALELGWIIDPLPQDRTFDLNPGESKTTIVTVKPTEDFKPGAYAPTLYVDSYRGNNYKTYTKSLKLYLSPEGQIEYFPSLTVTVDMDEKINPQEPVPIKLFINSRNPLNLTNLKLKIQSDMSEFQKDVIIDIPPLEKKTVEFTIVPSEFQQPKDYTLFFVFEHKGQTVKVVEKKIEVVSLLPEFSVNIVEDIIFFKQFKQVSITNPGNVLNKQEVKIPVSFWSSLFIKSPGSEYKTIEGSKFLVWKLSLTPNETISVNYVVNYRILFYLLLVILIFGSFYWYVQTPIVAKKSAITTKSDEEGALSEIKVTLEVNNKSGKPLKGVKITDLVPGIANVEKSLELGTLKPQEVRHVKQGTKVIWSLAEIDSHEHRLITYKVKAKLNIVGTFSLPRAIVEFEKGKGKKGKSYSNIFRLSS